MDYNDSIRKQSAFHYIQILPAFFKIFPDILVKQIIYIWITIIQYVDYHYSIHRQCVARGFQCVKIVNNN